MLFIWQDPCVKKTYKTDFYLQVFDVETTMNLKFRQSCRNRQEGVMLTKIHHLPKSETEINIQEGAYTKVSMESWNFNFSTSIHIYANATGKKHSHALLCSWVQQLNWMCQGLTKRIQLAVSLSVEIFTGYQSTKVIINKAHWRWSLY